MSEQAALQCCAASAACTRVAHNIPVVEALLANGLACSHGAVDVVQEVLVQGRLCHLLLPPNLHWQASGRLVNVVLASLEPGGCEDTHNVAAWLVWLPRVLLVVHDASVSQRNPVCF